MGDNFQEGTWSSLFGAEYTDRNVFSPETIDSDYQQTYGVSRVEMNKAFLEELGLADKSVLEVGCNIGIQLNTLQKQGYKKLFGIELQAYAVEQAKKNTNGINIIQAVGDDIPYKTGYFDMVFTSGVLIHISPKNIGPVLDEIYRCTNKYIWGFEYFAEEYIEIPYRGNNNLLWKTNFAKLYLDRFPDLEMVKEQRFKYSDNDNYDSMFLLKKK
jgi:pseudaminic acid biosynthesis-associated methylase